MVKSFTGRKRVRKNFGRIPTVAPMPNLIEVQKSSYSQFLQVGVPAAKRTDTGLQEVLKSVFPIKDFSGRGELEFVKYELDEPKYDVDECIQRGMTYSAPLRVTLRLVVWDVDEDTGARSIRDIKEQDVYMGDMPLMTENGTFVVNGTERVIVSQMHRSPGVFFDHDKGKTHSSGKYLFAARVIPYRGSWLDFEFDAKDLVYVRIDRRRKLPVTTLLYALESADTIALRKERETEGRTVDLAEVRGMSQEEILSYFYKKVMYTLDKKGWKTAFVPEQLKGTKLHYDLVDAKTGEVLAEAGQKMTARRVSELKKAGVADIRVSEEEMLGRYIAEDMINEKTGEILAEAGQEITEDLLKLLAKHRLNELPVLYIDHVNIGPYIRNTLAADKNTSREEALIDIYKVMRPGEPPTVESADALFRGLFFDLERYDLSAVGRVKMNARLDFDKSEVPDTVRVLRKEDILEIVRVLVELKDGRGEIDDIDNLGNRRVRSVGELMENQYRLGLLRMERAIRERMSSVDIDSVMPHDLINAKPAAAAIREFFGSSQLSQFMDQNNPLAEVTHKRRLSALGPGGLTRDRAGFEVRDVHPTHYGRICPIETPEGPNIGLINSLATYARVNQYGFIESPYRKVVDGKVTNDVVYLSAMEENKYVIAQANAELDSKGQFKEELVSCRKNGEFVLVHPDEITLIDVSPKQLVSVAAALIPFLENDDANRALMGSNMQRQAVPLLQADAPLVGTGMEAAVARDSGASIVAKRGGVVQSVDGMRIVVRATDNVSASTSGVDIYRLHKFQRSNQSTCITQRPLVKVGDIVAKGDIIADASSTQLGELALGRNVLVAFMPWNGYNYEDAILISERIARDDVFTSIHIDEFEVMARDTKLGQEEITRDIPNVGEEALKQLDEAGVVYIGADVKAGDILVGKVTPKGESPMTPEEKLLRAIFGEKAADVRDTSLRVPPGISGTVVEVRVFSRRGVDKDERAMAIEQSEIEALAKDRDAEKAILEGNFYDRLKTALLGQKATTGAKNVEAGTVLTEDVLNGMPASQWRKIAVEDDTVMADIEQMSKVFDASIEHLQGRFENKVEKLQRGDEMPPGVLKMVKVFIAVKRKLQPGDKMAGRHGNKGVVSRILPIEDMPHLADGTPVDLVLNPLGVPSRMNVGQILETHLGWACATLGRQVHELYERVVARKASVEDLRTRLEDVYGKKEYKDNIAKLSDDEVMELADNLKSGLPIATPVFDGAREADINMMLEKAGLPTSGQVQLFDGRTGEAFERPVTVGVIYMLKLHHLVDEKIHARSIGPYSLVTQQPLGGKAQFGGQRFGEMEVWALEAYGSAYTLQEILTVKSDDVSGRTKVYESIVRGDDKIEAGIPESFNVLVKEMRSLCLNVELNQREF
ncbi:MAG: DNA-directed RNA polymerase subunit beta [Alphaproteobacteria bacterium]